MENWPEILELMGEPPRALGALPAHVESVQRVEGQRVVASVLLHAAFPVQAMAQVAFRAVSAGELAPAPLVVFDLPVPEGSQVTRLRVPLVLPEGVTQVLVQIHAPAPGSSSEGLRLMVGIDEGPAEALSGPVLETVWAPGEAMKSCTLCGREVTRVEYEQRVACRACDVLW